MIWIFRAFLAVNVKASVNENSNVSTSVASMTATDKDSPVLKYKIAGGNADVRKPTSVSTSAVLPQASSSSSAWFLKWLLPAV